MRIRATTLEQPNVNGMTILKWIFRELNRGVKWICLAKNRPEVMSYECGNKPLDSMKCKEFLD